MSGDELYIGVIKVLEPWIVIHKRSERPEHLWYAKMAIIPGLYKLLWIPNQPFDNVYAWLKGMVLESRFQGQRMAHAEDRIEDFHFITSEHDVVVAIEGKGDRPYQFQLDLAVVTTGWQQGILKVLNEVHEYREGKFSIVEGATI